MENELNNIGFQAMKCGVNTGKVLFIDPDVDKCGVAVAYDRIICEAYTMKFYALLEYIEKGEVDLVVVDAGWLNKKTTFAAYRANQRAREFIAMNIGRNHQVGMLIVEWCKRVYVKVIEHKPISRKWSAEFTVEMLARLNHPLELNTKNQDVVDAVALAVKLIGANE